MSDRPKQNLSRLDAPAENAPTTSATRRPGFHRLTLEDRLGQLIASGDLTRDEARRLHQGTSLLADEADRIVENVVGVLPISLGLATNFTVNDKDIFVPMATEEPSTVAAASKAARLVGESGGFSAAADQSDMIGQIALYGVPDPRNASARLMAHRDEIIARANETMPRMLERGGGATDLEIHLVETDTECPMVIVHLHIDVREAMGANIVNSCCEYVAPLVERIGGGRVLMSIVSNLADRRLARASFRVPVDRLAQGGFTGRQVAERLVLASRWAQDDPYRAATHNKGMLNGIGAMALALGQDWRAVEAGAHAHAARTGRYRGLSTFEIEGDSLIARTELPLQVGWTGGTSSAHGGVRIMKRLTRIESARELSAVMAAVGLAQNFAACLALCTEGIQSGHMPLHARSATFPKVTMDRSAGASAEAPGKAILIGEHSVVYGHPSIVIPLVPGLKVHIAWSDHGPHVAAPGFDIAGGDLLNPGKQNGFLTAAHRAIKLYGLQDQPISVEVESALLPGVGLGSSASFSVALCRALEQFARRIDGRRLPVLAEAVHQMETVFHRQPSGADATAVMANDVIWFQRGNPDTVTPIRCARRVTGVVSVVDRPALTSEMVALVAKRRRQEPGLVDRAFDEISDLAVDAMLAIQSGDHAALGEAMSRNHERLARVGVSTATLDKAVEAFLKRGALGAKLTGAGGGGAIIAIIDQDHLDELLGWATSEYEAAYTFGFGDDR